MNIMSFNTQHCLNYLEQKIDFEIMAKAILDCNADIVGLNEMRGSGSDPEFTDQVKILAELTKMPYYIFAPAIQVGNKGPYGNGFLSKIPIVKAETIMIPDPERTKVGGRYETRCVLRVELEGGITVLVTHMGLVSEERVNAVATVLDHLAEEKCILMGDFNMKPDDAILAPIYAKMTDTAEKFDCPKLSSKSDNPKVKIDFIFVSKDVEVVSADIPAIIASDHRPHVANLNL